MALLKLGGLIADIRGSVGGVTFARNRGGAYARNRTVPINPSSTRQTAVRALLGDLSNVWTTTLTQAQRAAWELYAANVPLINPLGEARNVSGINMFVRTNSVMLDTGGTRLDDAPTEFTVGPTITPSFSIDAAADTFDINDLGGYPETAPGVRLFVAVGRPQNPGINFYKSPFRKAYGDLIVEVTNPAPVADIPLPYPVAAGQALFIRSIALTPDGRLGGEVIQRFLVA